MQNYNPQNPQPRQNPQNNPGGRGYYQNQGNQQSFANPRPNPVNPNQFSDIPGRAQNQYPPPGYAQPGQPPLQPKQKKKKKIKKPKIKYSRKGFWMALTSFLVMVSLVALGFWNGLAPNYDKEKEQDVVEIIQALEMFYENSAASPDQRFYPISVCSSSPNEIDYEYTLRKVLTGLRKDIEKHAYIQPEDYPVDPQGTYYTQFSDRKGSIDCLDQLPFDSSLDSYPEGFKTCDFDGDKLNSCYLYATDASGESYQFGYYSEAEKEFMIYREFRNEGLELVS